MGFSTYVPLVSDQVGELVGETKVKIEPGRMGAIAFTEAVRSDKRRQIPIESCLLAIVREVGKGWSRHGDTHHECKTEWKTRSGNEKCAALVTLIMTV